MPNAVDLTTLYDLKNYISPALAATTASDPILTKIITAVSRGINRYCSRNLAVGNFTEVRNGQGLQSIRTLVYPILGVTSVVISPGNGAAGTTVTPSNSSGGPNLTNDAWFIYVRGICLPCGAQNITLNYTGGFLTPGQLQVLILPGWVANATITQNQQIQVGGFYFQALNSGTSAGTVPTFNDQTNSLTTDNNVKWICLGVVVQPPPNAAIAPDDLQQACLQQSALLFKNRTRVGDMSTGEGPERINYFVKDAHPSTLELIKRHREVFPTEGMGPV